MEESSGPVNEKAGKPAVSVGEIFECVVEKVLPYGAFVRLEKLNQKAMIHVSELSNEYVRDINKIISVNNRVKAKVVKIDNKGRIDLSIKQLSSSTFNTSNTSNTFNNFNSSNTSDTSSFEKKMASFLRTSEAKIMDLNTRLSNRNSSRNKRSSRSRD